MMHQRFRLFILPLLLLLVVSCGEFNKIHKSTDIDLKYEYAKKMFEAKKYAQAYSLLQDIVTMFKGTDRGEESLYLLAQCYYGAKDYSSAATHFTEYYKTYPKGQYAEQSRFYAAESFKDDSTEPRLDQSPTYRAINEYYNFLEYHPESERTEEARARIYDLREKLAQKEYLNAKLYFDMGNYMGNNYRSCVITATNAINTYPDSHLRETFSILILRAKYYEAIHSVEEKKEERYREVVDEYYNYINEYPEGKFMKEAKNYLAQSEKIIKRKGGPASEELQKAPSKK